MRVASATLLVGLLLPTTACGAILGIEDGVSFDAGTSETSVGELADATTQLDATEVDAGSDLAADEAPGAADGAPDAQADAGADAATTTADCAGPAKRVFVSSATTTGAISDTGATGADAICQQLADAVKLGGTWRAWVSDDHSSPSKRFTKHSGPYVLVDRATVVACGWPGLTTAPALLHAIDRTEDAGAPAGTSCSGTGLLVWTDTLADGTEDPAGSSCTQWTDGTAATTGSCGCTDLSTAGGWSLGTGLDQPCDARLPVYCFEQ